jgi:cytochrome c oxidase assembly protein subunit 15
LFGSLVGLLTVFLAVSLWIKESRPWLRWLGVIALGAVIVQGVLGGLRVTLLAQTLAIIHACFAQAFFALAASLALFTSTEWRTPIVPRVVTDAERVQRLSVITTALIYVQLILGAVLRHRGEADVLHIVGALIVTVHVVLLTSRIVWNHSDIPVLMKTARILGILLGVQLLLGIGAYLGKFTQSGSALNPYVVPLATTHVLVGALMLGTCLILTLRAYRLLTPPPLTLQSQALSKQASL